MYGRDGLVLVVCTECMDVMRLVLVVEVVLTLTGATMVPFLCYVYPPALLLKLSTGSNRKAKVPKEGLGETPNHQSILKCLPTGPLCCRYAVDAAQYSVSVHQHRGRAVSVLSRDWIVKSDATPASRFAPAGG